MAKVLTVNEVLEEIKAKENSRGTVVLNRFNKKKFEKLMKAMINDPEFATQVAVVKKGELETVEDIKVSASFRKFIQHVVEKAGVDKSESSKVLDSTFTVDKVEGMYEFFATAMYLYMEQGNKFDLLPKQDFKGSLYIKNNKPSKKVSKAYHPKTRDFLGEFETERDSHRSLGIKSACPSYLKKRKKVK